MQTSKEHFQSDSKRSGVEFVSKQLGPMRSIQYRANGFKKVQVSAITKIAITNSLKGLNFSANGCHINEEKTKSEN